MSEPVVISVLMPHPPVIVPAVGRGRERDAAATCDAMAIMATRVVESRPDALVLISPHTPRRPRMFALWDSEVIEGDMGRFGAPEAAFELPCDRELLDAISEEAERADVITWRLRAPALDHGAGVPLWYLTDAGWDGPTVVVGLNYPGEGQLTAFGEAIRRAAESLGRRTAVIASGDMSHRLQPGAPGGYHRRAAEFDHAFVDRLRAKEDARILAFEHELQQLAGEDVVDSTIVALAAGGYAREGREVLSYEGPFGVGYCVAQLAVPRDCAGEMEGGELLPAFARAAVDSHVRSGTQLHAATPASPYLLRQAGVFVTIREPGGSLRGCIGSVLPQRSNIVEETIDRAVAAATRDPRFAPVKEEELGGLTFEVSVLHAPQPATEADLDPHRYGVIVEDAHGRRALMLPNVEGLETVAVQLAATRRKAGIPPTEAVRLQRFRVDKFEERK